MSLDGAPDSLLGLLTSCLGVVFGLCPCSSPSAPLLRVGVRAGRAAAAARALPHRAPAPGPGWLPCSPGCCTSPRIDRRRLERLRAGWRGGCGCGSLGLMLADPGCGCGCRSCWSPCSGRWPPAASGLTTSTFSVEASDACRTLQLEDQIRTCSQHEWPDLDAAPLAGGSRPWKCCRVRDRPCSTSRAAPRTGSARASTTPRASGAPPFPTAARSETARFPVQSPGLCRDGAQPNSEETHRLRPAWQGREARRAAPSARWAWRVGRDAPATRAYWHGDSLGKDAGVRRATAPCCCAVSLVQAGGGSPGLDHVGRTRLHRDPRAPPHPAAAGQCWGAAARVGACLAWVLCCAGGLAPARVRRAWATRGTSRRSSAGVASTQAPTGPGCCSACAATTRGRWKPPWRLP